MYENKLTGAAHIKLQNAVRDLEDRHRDIYENKYGKKMPDTTLIDKCKHFSGNYKPIFEWRKEKNI